VVNKCFHKYLDDFVVLFLDDLLVFSKSAAQHADHLRIVLTVLRENKFYCKLDKCEFFKDQVSFLGHIISAHGIHVDPKKIEAVVNWPTLRNVKHVRSFLGLCSYYRKFVKDFSKIAAPLTELTKKDVPYVWTPERESAFHQLKLALTQAPVLIQPDPSLPYRITTDASDYAVGGVLSQITAHGDQPIAFESRKLNSAERGYPTHDKEMAAVVHCLRTWRCYIEGVQTTVVTDHHSLIYFMNQPKLSRRQVRWMELMQEYGSDLKFQFLNGRANIAADALSRRPDLELANLTISIDPSWFIELKAGYLLDAECLKILRAAGSLSNPRPVEESANPQHNAGNSAAATAGSTRTAGTASGASTARVPATVPPAALLNFRVRDGVIFVANDDAERLYIPDVAALQLQLLREHHDSKLSGHLGMDKTYALLARNYYWPNMRDTVRDYIRSCPACQGNKPTNQKPAGLMQPLPIPDYNWQQVSMDLITQLPKTASGHDAIVTVVDRLSKMTHFIPATTDINAPKLAQLFIDHVVRLHGMPTMIVSDRDPRFTSTFWQNVMDRLGTYTAMSTAYHPQTDGQTERANRTIEEMLRSYVSTNQTDWDEHVSMLELAYNNATQASTQFSPFFMNYGLHPNIPGSMFKPATSTNPASNQFLDLISGSMQAAKLHLSRAQLRQKQFADRKRRELEFSEGEEVLLSTRNLTLPGPAAKLQPKWIGPYKIEKKIGNLAYKLEIPADWRVHDVFHVSNLKTFVVNPNQFAGRPTRAKPVAFARDGVPLYEPEAILNRMWLHFPGKSKPEWGYLIQWKDFSEHDTTWEPIENLSGSKQLLEAYNTLHPFPSKTTTKNRQPTTKSVSATAGIAGPSSPDKPSKPTTPPTRTSARLLAKNN